MPIRHPVLPLCAALLLAGLAQGARAADIDVTLQGHTADLQRWTSGLYDNGWLTLTDPATSDGALPAGTLAVGDTLRLSLVLDQPLTVPAAHDRGGQWYSWLQIDLHGFVLPGPVAVTVAYQQSLAFFDHGVPVQPGGSFAPFGGCGGGLWCVGGGGDTGFPSFTFDAVEIGRAHV
jgi:hypothetical protein